jgi:alpha-galactosidase
MKYRPNPNRRTFLQLVSTLAMGTPGMMLAESAVAAESAPRKHARIGDGAMWIEFDDQMRTSIACTIGGRETPLTKHAVSEYLVLADGSKLGNFKLVDVTESTSDGAHGAGKCLVVTGVAAEGIEKTVRVSLCDRYPGFAFYAVSYRNVSKQECVLKSWTNGAGTIVASRAKGVQFWSFSGSSHEDRRDWVQPLHDGFEQANYMGMSASDYGGGTPIVDVWRNDAGLAVGHVETTPKLVSLPIRAGKAAVEISMCEERPIKLQPGEQFNTCETFVTVHRGDYFTTLDTYRRVMAERGLQAPKAPAESYEPIWCAWGYERDFSMARVEGTLAKAKDLGLEWAVIDDGWQTGYGDWYVDVKKFPRGEADLKRMVQEIRGAGLKPRLWWSPLSVGPGTDLMHDHTDMLLLDKDGALQHITWWNSFYLCPAYEPTITYTKALVRKILGEWGFAGLKIDGQHLNGVAPCFNPAHHHARPEESVEKLQDFYRAIYETAMEVNPHAVVEICPCGTSYAFHNMPYMNQAPASDPESSWQVRHKGKTLKALMGPSAPYAGDHVELSDGGDDFASTVGIGAVVSTKFTWPVDPKPKDSFLLTEAREQEWRKWIGLYKDKMLPTGTYRGDLYDIGFDKPEAHVVEKDGRLYFAFYAKTWNGPIPLRGLKKGAYVLRDYFNDRDLGKLGDGQRQLNASFERFLLVEAIPTDA